MGKSDESGRKADKKRHSSTEDDSPVKRMKTEDEEADQKQGDNKYNPYLAHMDDGSDTKDLAYGSGGHVPGSAFRSFTRRQTTAKQAAKAEAGDNNPFTGNPHSQQYFGILKTRHNLPVHKQRSVSMLTLFTSKFLAVSHRALTLTS